MKRYTVPILNSEYKVYVYIGSAGLANKTICSYLGTKQAFISEDNRGKSIYRKGFHPCIWVDERLTTKERTATLAHEAIHAVSDIMAYLGMDLRDTTGNELLAHSVAAIIRTNPR